MRIVTCNVNGLRSAHSKGFTDSMLRQEPDFACLQEIKARESDLPPQLLAPPRPARLLPSRGKARLQRRGDLLAPRARPRGDPGAEALARKYAFLERFFARLGEMRACGRELVVCGDWNIAHREIDVKNWQRNAFGNARAKNMGWRIDYQIATPGIAKTARKAAIYTGEVFSDHAPFTIDYDREP